jgi:hypothetical protein
MVLGWGVEHKQRVDMIDADIISMLCFMRMDLTI